MSDRPDTFRYRYAILPGCTVTVAAHRYVRMIARNMYRRERRDGDSRADVRNTVAAFLLWSTARADDAPAVRP